MPYLGFRLPFPRLWNCPRAYVYPVNSINDHLRWRECAIVGHSAVAMAAPMVLVIAVTGVFVIVVLPGGIYLLDEYALKGISIGETQFNIIQILLIMPSVFYSSPAPLLPWAQLLSGQAARPGPSISIPLS